MPEAIKYTPEALKGKSDDELLALLKQSWGYSPDQPLIVIGELLTGERIVLGQALPYFRLNMLKSINDFRALQYPVDEGHIGHTIFIPPIVGRALVGDQRGAVYFKARAELSPKIQREKQRNPLTLQVVPNTIEALEDLPFELPNINKVDGRSLLQRSIVNFYLHKNKKTLEADSAAVRATQEQEQKRLKATLEADFAAVRATQEQEQKRLKATLEVDSAAARATQEQEQKRLEASLARLQSAEKQVDEQLARNTNSLHETLEQLDAQQSLLTALTDNYHTKKAVMNSHLARLNDFVRSKADTLLRLGFIDESDMRAILGEPESPDAVNSYDFQQDFNMDDGAAIKHIQAFLHAKGIYYKQALLKDFLALLRTQDLIVLAGDSGSGKTNLVKSFAQATGAKAIIIPVKPNWTSTEDLLGYYNPLEKRYITTQFLDALIDAANNPQVPYLICLDEMNLARVEYYFADFLSLLEERSKQPEIFLYSDTEASHVQHEYGTFLKLVEEVAGSTTLAKGDFSDLLKDENANARLHRLCGFKDGESLLTFHSRLRRLLAGLVRTPSSITLPANVRFIGAINVDETTHYLSPKILDRAHVIRFTNPLLFDWQAFEKELQPQDRDLSMPVRLQAAHLGQRAPYPEFDLSDAFVGVLVDLARDYLSKLGIEFGFRTVRQARNYALESRQLGMEEGMVLNNFVLHKVLPKLMLDGTKKVSKDDTRKEVLYRLRAFLKQRFETLESITGEDSCIAEMDDLIRNAEANDWAVNYWAR